MDPAIDEKTPLDGTTTPTVVAWQGWRLSLPGPWAPVELGGDYAKGRAIFTDPRHARIALRWLKAAKNFDPEQWAASTLACEVGRVSADVSQPFSKADWVASRLHLEQGRPGRGVWVGYSPQSQRAMELVCHGCGEGNVLADLVLPSLADLDSAQPMPWAIFDLSCVVPQALRLARQRLNAGDLTLCFAAQGRAVEVRQVAMAELALKRLSLRQWQEQHVAGTAHFHADGDPEVASLQVGGHELSALRVRMPRRRGSFWRWRLSPALVNYAVYDEARNCLIFVQATDDELARVVGETVGAVV